MFFPENAPRDGHRFAHQRPGFFEVFQIYKGRRVVDSCYEGVFMFFTVEPHISVVNVSFDPYGVFNPSELIIRDRKIALRCENVSF